MLIPCDDTRGCGTLMPMPDMSSGTAVDPITEIPYERMTNFTEGAQMMPAQTAAQTSNPNRTSPIPAPVPGTSDVPTQTGVIATTPTPTGATFLPGSGIGSAPAEGLFPGVPGFAVPSNPLLPPGYQEVLDYESLQYLNGFLRTQIGKYIRVQQLIGASVIEDRYGYLVGVGINYILLQEISTNNILALDFYNIKYVYIYYTKPDLPTNGTR